MSLLHILGRGFQVVLIDWGCLFSGIYLLDILLWQVRFYSLRTNLDHSQVVNIIKLTSPVLKLNIFVNCLLVLTKDCVLRLFLLELSQPTTSTLPDQENSSNKGEVEWQLYYILWGLLCTTVEKKILLRFSYFRGEMYLLSWGHSCSLYVMFFSVHPWRVWLEGGFAVLYTSYTVDSFIFQEPSPSTSSSSSHSPDTFTIFSRW